MPREKGEGRLWGKAGAGYLSSGKKRGVSVGTVGLLLFGGLLWLNGDCW